MTEVIINGIKIISNYSYIEFKTSLINNVVESDDGLKIIMEFTLGSTSNDLIPLSPLLSLVDDILIEPTEVLYLKNSILEIDGIYLQKLVLGEYIFRQFILDDQPTNLYQDSSKTILIINKSESQLNYLTLLNSLKYLKLNKN